MSIDLLIVDLTVECPMSFVVFSAVVSYRNLIKVLARMKEISELVVCFPQTSSVPDQTSSPTLCLNFAVGQVNRLCYSVHTVHTFEMILPIFSFGSSGAFVLKLV